MDSLHLERLRVGFQFKHNYFDYVKNKSENSHIDMTISDCVDKVSIKGQCFDIVVQEHLKNIG